MIAVFLSGCGALVAMKRFPKALGRTKYFSLICPEYAFNLLR